MPEEIALLFEYIKGHLDTIQERFEKIKSPGDFVKDKEGKVLLDAIAIRLQALSETLKKIYKKNPAVLNQFPQIEWKEIIRFREIISHHYELLNYEVVFDICKNDLPELKVVIEKIIQQHTSD